jgi:hypothetical protein
MSRNTHNRALDFALPDDLGNSRYGVLGRGNCLKRVGQQLQLVRDRQANARLAEVNSEDRSHIDQVIAARAEVFRRDF